MLPAGQDVVKKLKGWAQQLAIVIAIVVGIGWWQTRDLLQGGVAAPAIAVMTTDGGTFDLSAHKGKTVLMYFFAPWCGVCKVSAGNLTWIQKLTDPATTSVVAVALDYESRASIDEFVKEAGIEGVTTPIGDDAIRDAYRVRAYPSYYVIKDDGTVAFVSVGYSTFLGMLIRTWLA